MTEKKEHIINAALTLFANEGYNSTSTSKVSKLANVSEGLIFKHFKNKEGLLKAILEEGQARCEMMTMPMFEMKDPKEVIRMAIEMPFLFTEKEHEFWKLRQKLMWEVDYADDLTDACAGACNNPDDMSPVKQALINAFEKLGYKYPDLEADVIFVLFEGISSALIKGNVQDIQRLKGFLMRKYNLHTLEKQ